MPRDVFNPVPSVTDILGLLSKFDQVPPDLLAEAQARGTAVHAWAHKWVQGIDTTFALHEAYHGYTRSFLKWWDVRVRDHERVQDSEMTLYSQTTPRFHGTSDLLVFLQGDDFPTVIDLKTSVSTDSKLWPMQVAAYRQLAVECLGLERVGVGTLQLKSTGALPKWKSWGPDGDCDPAARAAWHCALNLFHYIRG